MKGNIVSIIDALDNHYNKKALENRKKLKPIIKTVIFCGRNGLPLRGHKDYGEIDFKNLSYES